MSQDTAPQRRARQTVTNLLLALAACAAMVLAIILVVPRDDSSLIKPVDYVAIANDASEATGRPLIVPSIESDWWSNSARLSTSPKDGTEASWYAGFVGPKNEYIGFTQTFGTNPTWLAMELKDTHQSGTYQSGSMDWEIFESDEKHDPVKTRDFIMVGQIANDTVLVYGTASRAEFETFVDSVSNNISQLYPR